MSSSIRDGKKEDRPSDDAMSMKELPRTLGDRSAIPVASSMLLAGDCIDFFRSCNAFAVNIGEVGLIGVLPSSCDEKEEDEDAVLPLILGLTLGPSTVAILVFIEVIARLLLELMLA